MKKIIFVFSLCFFAIHAMAQFVGQTTITFNDPSRRGGFGFGGGTGRQIQTEIYYPATANGTNKPVANSSYPVIVFGHGFVIRWDAYAFLYNALARMGYIVALPRTEGEILPNHEDFGKDLAIVATRMQAENNKAGSLFRNRVAATTAVGGHSMGGKAVALSDKYQTVPVAAYFNFAPANGVGNGDMFADATKITEPFLVISGAFDKVAPANDNAKPLYNALTSSCKTYLNLRGGYHCQFNDFNLNCHAGESALFPSWGGLSRSQQQSKVLGYVVPFLDFYLKYNTAQGTAFVNTVNNATDVIEKLRSCGSLKIGDFVENTFQPLEEEAWYIYPNPIESQLVVQINAQQDEFATVQVYGIQGDLIIEEKLALTTGVNQWFYNTGDWVKGIYTVRIINKETVNTKQVMK